METKRYLFGEQNRGESEAVFVHATDLYSDKMGYGFVTEENRKKEKFLQYAECNSGFDTVYWYQNQKLTSIEEDENGCFLDSEKEIEKLGIDENRMIPLCFKTKVAKSGNYRVRMVIKGDTDEKQEILIFHGRRRLGFKGIISKNKFSEFEFTVNVSDIIPRGQESVVSDKTIDFTICGQRPSVFEIEIKEESCPTIYIAGDSTVTDQPADYPYAPETSYCGWGQMLSVFLKPGIAVSNHAHSGLTTESFRSEGHYGIVQSVMKRGDWCLIQFAHNDQKLEHLKAEEGYRENLIQYIGELRKAGVYPILVTPIARNSWKGNDNTYNDLLVDYAAACIRLGREMEVPVIDLHAYSMKMVVKLGREASKSYYFPCDYTHSNDYGAYKMAGYIAAGLPCQIKDRFVKPNVAEWIPPENIELPTIPKELKNVKNPDEVELFGNLERPEDICNKVEAMDMVIQTAHFFPTNVYNDMFEDVVGHEWYAGSVECAYQNGILPERMLSNKKIRPLDDISLQDFCIFLMNGYKSRMRLPEDKECPYDKSAGFEDRSLIRAAYHIGILKEHDDLSRHITRGEAAEMCRALHI